MTVNYFDQQIPNFLATPTLALANTSPGDAATLGAPGGSFDGVVKISDGRIFGSGTLLSTGHHILTAAHVVDGMSLSQLKVYFSLVAGVSTFSITKINIHPGWIGAVDSIENDVAVLELSAVAPVLAPRYELYTQRDEVGQQFTVAGYGVANAATPDGATSARRVGNNIFDADATKFNAAFGGDPGGSKQLIFDYDDGTAAHDAFGRYFGLAGLGLGAREAMLTPGDSGGGAFIQKADKWLVAGINSYTARPIGDIADIDNVANGSIGEFGAEMRVSSFAAWIDSVTGVDRVIVGQVGTHPNRDNVLKKVIEGGITTFLVEIGQAQSVDVKVHYETRDGSAKAGLDYYAAHGDVIFTAGQTWCEIKIETAFDKLVEGDETFSLALTKPEGGMFANGAVELVAVRTIVDGPVV